MTTSSTTFYATLMSQMVRWEYIGGMLRLGLEYFGVHCLYVGCTLRIHLRYVGGTLRVHCGYVEGSLGVQYGYGGGKFGYFKGM